VCVPVALTRLVPAGIVASKTALGTVIPDRFPNTTVYVSSSPGNTGLRSPLTPTDRPGVASVTTFAEAFAP